MLKKINKKFGFILILSLYFILFFSCSFFDFTAPGEVINLTATATYDQVILTWDDPTDSDFSKVEISYSPGGSSAITINKGIETSTITGLNSGTIYTFTVKTIDTNGNQSSGRIISTIYQDDNDTTPPAEVENLTIQVNTYNGNFIIQITWACPTDPDFSKVEIIYTPGGDATPIYVDKGNTTYSTNDIPLPYYDTIYTFTVKTIDTNGNKSSGKIISIIVKPQ